MKVERRTVQKLERKNTTAATTEFRIFSLNAVDDNSITTHAVTTTSASDLELCVVFWVLRLILFLEGLLKTANILFQFDR